MHRQLKKLNLVPSERQTENKFSSSLNTISVIQLCSFFLRDKFMFSCKTFISLHIIEIALLLLSSSRCDVYVPLIPLHLKCHHYKKVYYNSIKIFFCARSHSKKKIKKFLGLWRKKRGEGRKTKPSLPFQMKKCQITSQKH